VSPGPANVAAKVKSGPTERRRRIDGRRRRIWAGCGLTSAAFTVVIMKLVAEYLERSVHFARMAAEADDPDLKEQLLKQAAAYRKLAEKRAALLERPESN
jgi:hypothetical protein